jgi:hypothetical protein
MSTGEVHDDAISLVQERMWLADRIAPRGSVNSVAAIVPLVGPLDADLLRRSVDEVVRRHEVLRTSYPAERGKPRRRVLERLALDLPVVDLSALPPTIRRSETIRLAGEVAREPFDLPRGPLVRGRLFRLTPTEHVLVFALHYIVADSGSLGIFIREVATLYDAFSGGRPSPLPELVTQYAEVARHEREAFERGALEREIAWWRERLDGAPDVLALPSDRPRKDVATLRSGQVLFYVPPELTARVRAFARRERTTPFLVFLTAFEALLARFAGTREIVVGTPVANRVGHDVTRLIGMFANTLVLRTDLGPAQSLRDALGAVQRTVLEANRHRELPFELLAESLLRGRPRVRAHAPIFQIVVNYMDPSIDSGRFGDVEVRELEASGGDAQAIPAMWWRSASENHSFYDLFLTLSPVGERTDCAIEYATDLFEPASIDALVASFRDAIELLVAEPDAALSSVTLAPRLVSLAEASKARARPYRIAIAATFTAEPVDDVIAFWGKELGLTLGVEHAGFGQVFQELVSPDGTFRNNKYGLNVIFVRFEDWGSESPAVARDLAGALRTSAAAAKVPHLVCVTAPTSGNEAASEAATEILVRELDGSAVRIVTSAEIDAL